MLPRKLMQRTAPHERSTVDTVNALGAASQLRVRNLERITAPSVETFRRQYVTACRPVVLSGVISEWPALRRWSLDYLRDQFAATPVKTIRADAGKVVMDAEYGAIEEHMRLGDCIDEFRSGANHRYVTSPMAQLPNSLRRDAPPPRYFAEASWHDSNIWIGAVGTVAPMHRDLADNLHALVCGRKRFTLVAPRQSGQVYPNRLFDRFPNGCRIDIEHPDFTRFPKLRAVETLVAELEPGDAIYIPRRWWHHVRTLAVSTSVNFWWASGTQRALVLAADLVKRVRGISR